MNKFFFWLFLRSEGQRIWLPPWFFRLIKLGLLALLIAVTIYTIKIILTLPERTSGHHVHTLSIR